MPAQINIDEDLVKKTKIQAMVVIAGGKFPYLEGSDKLDLSEPIDLGIDFTG